MASSAKKLQNDVTQYEIDSDRKINAETYYIVHLKISNGDGEDKSEDISMFETSLEIVKNYIRKTYEGDENPLVAYVHENSVYLLFSSVESGTEHFRHGSHHRICSFFASSVSRSTDVDVDCSIVEFDSRTKILVYFQMKIYENTRRKAMELVNPKDSPGVSSSPDMSEISIGEILETMSQPAQKKWAKLKQPDKHGSFYKYKKQDGKHKLVALSELIDLRQTGKYMDYFFN